MKILGAEGLSTREAEARTGISHSDFSRIRQAKFNRLTIETSKVCFVFAVVLLGSIGSLVAQAPLHDPNLPTVSPESLQQLSNNRVRQKIIENSQAHYAGRCVCQYMTQDSQRRSCKGRHEVIKTKPVPICYPRQVTPEMVSMWHRQHQ